MLSAGPEWAVHDTFCLWFSSVMHRPLTWYNRVDAFCSKSFFKAAVCSCYRTTTPSMPAGSCRLEAAGDHYKQMIAFLPSTLVWRRWTRRVQAPAVEEHLKKLRWSEGNRTGNRISRGCPRDKIHTYSTAGLIGWCLPSDMALIPSILNTTQWLPPVFGCRKPVSNLPQCEN